MLLPMASPRNTDPAAEPNAEVVERAAEWMAHLGSGDADADDMAAFLAWRAAHPSHALAIERMGGLGGRTGVEREALRRLFRPRARRRGVAGAVTAIIVLVGAGWFAARLPIVQIPFADERTAIGEIRPVVLPDGSRIVLASGSAVDIDMDGGARTIRLLQGDVLSEVVRGRDAPFRVVTMDGVAEALGTSFTVRKEEKGTQVAVISSRVRVCPAAGRDGCRILAPGERVRLSDGGIARLPDIAPGDAAAWADGWLPADGRLLVEVLDELNRWRESPIRFDRAALKDLRVSGIFPLRDGDGALANLARSQPIAIDRSNPASPVVRRKPE